MSSPSLTSLRFAGYPGQPDRAGLGPTGVFLDHLLASSSSSASSNPLPSVICVQESVRAHTDEMVAVLNAAVLARGGPERYAVVHGGGAVQLSNPVAHIGFEAPGFNPGAS
jgi:hypothetical protein